LVSSDLKQNLLNQTLRSDKDTYDRQIVFNEKNMVVCGSESGWKGDNEIIRDYEFTFWATDQTIPHLTPSVIAHGFASGWVQPISLVVIGKFR